MTWEGIVSLNEWHTTQKREGGKTEIAGLVMTRYEKIWRGIA